MSDKELIARLRASSRHPMMDNNCKVDVFLVNDAADRIEALSGLNKKLTLKVSHYSDLLYDQLGTPCEQIRHKQEIEALEAKLAQAVEALGDIAATKTHPLGETPNAHHMREKARATLAKIKGESHE